MIVIIPLGGIGERFKKEGYKYPKALINVLGKPILFWLLDSLKVPTDTMIYIPYNKEYKSYRLEDLLKKTIRISYLNLRLSKIIHAEQRKLSK